MSAPRSVALPPSTLAARGGREFTAARTSLPASRLQCCKLRISSGLCFSWELQVHFQNYYSQFDLLSAPCPLLVPEERCYLGVVLRGMLTVFIFLELRKERVVLAAQPNPEPSRAAWTGTASPRSERRAPLQRARPSHFVCPRRWEPNRPLPGTLRSRRRWAALHPRMQAADAIARWCSRTGSASVGKGFSAPAPRKVNNKAGAAARDRYFPGSNKVGLAAFAPTPFPPRPGEITVCKNGAKWAESQGCVAVVAPPCRYDVSFSFAKLLVSCKACSRPRARRDGRVERCVLTGGSAEGRRARRA